MSLFTKKEIISIVLGYIILALVLLGICASSGCATPAWKHYSSYRGDVCEICGKGPTQWAHEYPQCDYKELINDPDNGHTLCRKCHVFFHYQNTSRYWNDDMDRIIEMMKASKRTYRKYEK